MLELRQPVDGLKLKRRGRTEVKMLELRQPGDRLKP